MPVADEAPGMRCVMRAEMNVEAAPASQQASGPRSQRQRAGDASPIGSVDIPSMAFRHNREHGTDRAFPSRYTLQSFFGMSCTTPKLELRRLPRCSCECYEKLIFGEVISNANRGTSPNRSVLALAD
jgi:hypothetical protein